MLINVTWHTCEDADADWLNERVDYFTAVKRCFSNVTQTEAEAVEICSNYQFMINEGMRDKHLPSTCASAISKFL